MQQVEQGSLLHAQPAAGVEEANHWECLQVWHAWDDMQASWGDERHVNAWCHFGESCMGDACFQGWQPYVSKEEQFDIPFIAHESGSHDIQLGVDRQISHVFESACSIRGGYMGADGKPWTQFGPSGTPEEKSTSEQAPSSSSSLRLLVTGLASLVL